ncbi:MAG TPA: molybdopterin cofactor-binding domain-containing protein [Acidobacteriota bacterium]|nr:molybdopterin cofactor-binding domain-containing protein [Acidobacteriota bacterium]
MSDQQPWTWKVPEASENISRTMSRHDAYDRVSGKAVYTRDILLPGMLYAKILTSPYAHAGITSIDISRAKDLVGVRDILTYDDPDISTDRGAGADISGSYSILTLPRTGDFYRHPMGVVVTAESEEICDRALRLMEIEWEERSFVLDMEEAAKPDAPQIMPEVQRRMMGFSPGERGAGGGRGPNIIRTADRQIGNVEKGFAEADRVIEYSIRRQMNSPAGVEAMACVAQWKGDFLDLWVHHQANPQSELSAPRGTMGRFPSGPGAVGQPTFTHWSKIKVTFPYQGSWFGGLAWLAYSNSFVRLAVTLARRVNGRPVKLLYDESGFYCGGDEAGTYNCKVGVKKDGTITAFHWHMTGARNPATDKTHECTKIPNIRGTQTWPLTNKGFQGCFRHGAAECVPHNVMFDLAAAEFGLDPTEVALINDGCQGRDWEWITRHQEENGFPRRHSLKEVIEIGKKAIDWDRKLHPPGARKLANGRMHGMGFTSVNVWHWGAGMMSFVSHTHACLMLQNGKVTIIGTRCDMGIDTESGYRHCVAAEIGMKYDDVLIQVQSSDNSAYSLAQPAGSSGTVNALPQLIQAAREMKQKILERAAEGGSMPGSGFRFGAMGGAGASSGKKPEDFDIRDSMIFEKTNPERKRQVSEVTGGGFMGGNPIIVHPDVDRPASRMSGGMMNLRNYVMGRQAHFIEAEVDVETGMVYVTGVVCVNDVGHIFNRRGCEGQQYGGAVMGIGKSATEEKIYCPRTGVGLNFDLINYHIGAMNDYPVVDCHLIETRLGYGVYGSFGIGENIGAAMAAITSSAIYNAIGKWILYHPITPDKVLNALGKI